MTYRLNLLHLLLCGFVVLASTPAFAQMTPDNTLGAESSRLTPNVPIAGENGDRIDGGATRGSNLFHSFSQFNLDDGQRVYFGNPNGIENILTRVTGGNASNILGTLGVDGGANLFLINPNGIIFGQNARLDLRGSFVGTTANAIGFGEQGNFSATNPSAPPLLTVNPSALLYTQINRGAIANQGILTAQTGQSLVLAGGEINLNSSQMNTSGGRIELAAISGTGTVGLNVDNSLSIPTDLPRADIALFNSQIDVTAGSNSGVAIHARNLDISGNSFIYSHIGSDVEAVDLQAGDITLDATDTIQIRESSLIRNSVAFSESGKGGNINVTTGSLSLSDGAQISASTFGTGDAGSVFVQAKDSVSAAGNSAIFSNVQTGAVGNGGNINITAPTLSLIDGSELSTSVFRASNNLPAGVGIAGNVFVDVSGDVTISGVKDDRTGIFSTLGTEAKGKGGNINITAGSLSLSDGATLATSTYGTGDAGSVLVQAKNSVSAASNSAIFSRVENGAVGNGGNINITAPTLSLTDDGQVSTSVRGAFNNLPAGKGIAGNVFVDVSGSVTISGVKGPFPSGIFSYLGIGAKGKGGNINVKTGSLSLSDGAQLDATTWGTGDAGSVIIDARRVFLDGKNTIVFSIVETTGRGKGGDIGITTDSLSLTNGAVLTASTLGEGDPGNVLVQAKDSISVAGNSYILSDLRGGAKGKGGNINLKTGSLFLTDGAQISASTSGAGDAGSVFVQAKDSVSVANNSGIFSIVESGAVGNGGNINITAPTLSLTDGSILATFVRKASKNLPAGFGIAGNVIVDVTGDVTISGVKDGRSGIFSYLGEGAKGKGGNINLTAGSLFLTDGAQISASTFGIGDANSVLVQAKDSVSVARNSGIFSIVESGAVGNGGDVNITAPTLSLTDGSQLSTFVSGAFNNLPAGFGIAGNVIVDVSGNITISGVNSPSGISSLLGTGAKGKGGNINVTASSLSVTDGATLIASTGGEGDAGNIQINATDSVTFSGTSSSSGFSSALFTNTSPNSKGKGGDIAVNTNVLRVSDGAVLNAGTRNNSNGGNIIVNARQVEAINGGQFLTSTSGSGNAGKITLNATEQVNVNGSDPTFNDRVAKFGTRVANSEAVSGFFVRSEGSGIAGDIEVTSPQIRLDNGGKLNAESASGNGGNINIINSDLLLLRRNSTISTNAGLAQGAGNGGNITINAKTIASVPKENSDITANANEGSGGNVTITTDGLFGIARADDLTPFSDITASSELGVQGQIDITQPDVQPTQGLVELPGQILDASDQIASVCPNGNTASRPLGEFVVSGRGSLPPNPLELLVGTTSLSPLATLDGQSEANLPKTAPTPAIPPTPTAIVEAQGWVKTANGKIALVANAPSATPSAATTGATCPVSK